MDNSAQCSAFSVGFHLIIYLVRDLDCFRYVASKIQHESAVRAPEQSLIHLSVLAWTNISTVQGNRNKLFSFITSQGKMPY